MADPSSFRNEADGRPTFQNSEYPAGPFRQSEDAMLLNDPNMVSSSRMTLSASGRQTEMKIMAMEPEAGAPPERTQDYKGRIRTWPGILLLIGIVAAAAALISMGAITAHDDASTRAAEFERNAQEGRKIDDGQSSSGDIISDDGQVGNPKVYPDMGCELPDYLSKNGQIWARAANGTEIPVGIKGVNWFGMETGMALPFGLWENQNNGTSAYEIAAFLARNKFNSVRLPICIKSLINDLKPEKSIINLNTNRAINITSYMSTIQTIVQTMAYRHVTVMISLHTLDTRVSGGAWYSEALGVSEEDFLGAIDMLTENLCSDKYWNIIGLDLKNEPHECSWGSGTPDWKKGAELIGNRMLAGCRNWLAFVEGVNSGRTLNRGGKKFAYFDWWGGGLQGAATKPIELEVDEKVVYAPHYYNTGVNPAPYLYGGGTPGPDGTLMDYVELSDEDLKENVKLTMEDMFGFLAENKKEAVVLGEFAGLYANDMHPLKTTKRTSDFTIQVALDAEYAGGYMWSLNPESAYQFNPADTYGHFTEGLLTDDWLTPDKTFLEGMAAMDAIKDLKQFPCFPKEIKAEE